MGDNINRYDYGAPILPPLGELHRQQQYLRHGQQAGEEQEDRAYYRYLYRMLYFHKPVTVQKVARLVLAKGELVDGVMIYNEPEYEDVKIVSDKYVCLNPNGLRVSEDAFQTHYQYPKSNRLETDAALGLAVSEVMENAEWDEWEVHAVRKAHHTEHSMTVILRVLMIF